jgi:hypothetical protein
VQKASQKLVSIQWGHKDYHLSIDPFGVGIVTPLQERFIAHREPLLGGWGMKKKLLFGHGRLS